MKKVILGWGLLLPFALQAQVSKNFIDQPYVEVNGTADTMLTPNEIFVDIVISESDSKDKKSVEEQEQKLLGALKNIGVNTDKDLVTKNFSSKYSVYGLTAKVVKTKTYQVKVGSGLMLSKLFNVLEENKISNANVAKIGHTDMEQIRMMCRAKAVRNARAKAVVMTAALDQAIGAALFVNNYSNTVGGVPAYDNTGNSLYKSKVRTQDSSADIAEIEFEQIRVQEQVEVKFILK